MRVVTVYNSKGDAIKVTYGNEHAVDVVSSSPDTDSDEEKTNLVSPRSGETAVQQTREDAAEPSEHEELASPRALKAELKKKSKNAT